MFDTARVGRSAYRIVASFLSLFFISNLVALVPNTYWLTTVGTCGAFHKIAPQATMMRYVKILGERSALFRVTIENVGPFVDLRCYRCLLI